MNEHDEFARSALMGLLAALPPEKRGENIEETARLAYLYADAMLKVKEDRRLEQEKALAAIKVPFKHDAAGEPQPFQFLPQEDPPKGKPRQEYVE